MDSMLIYHFVDPDLKVETNVKNDGPPENGGIDFESLSAFLLFFCDKK